MEIDMSLYRVSTVNLVNSFAQNVSQSGVRELFHADLHFKILPLL